MYKPGTNAINKTKWPFLSNLIAKMADSCFFSDTICQKLDDRIAQSVGQGSFSPSSSLYTRIIVLFSTLIS